ncbi:MAG: carbohydrate kinase family protein [Clostridiales bacterium]|nr:carbohydrate kinase family protein [Candidatus Blautia equi]
MKNKKITIIGAAILDILAGPVDAKHLYENGSQAMDSIRMTFGGDALNETIALSRLGEMPELITLLGKDEAGQKILDHLASRGLSLHGITVREGLDTGMNIVLVDSAGERRFLTNPKSSLRKLSEKDILPHLTHAGEIISFASLFVSHALDIPAMERICRKIKETPGRTLVMDMTKPKKGETLSDLTGILPYVDYLLPNAEEAAMLTGETDPVKNAKLLVDAGAAHTVIKTGKKGCVFCEAAHSAHTAIHLPPEIHESSDAGYRILRIPAVPGIHAVDSTGAGDCFAAGFLYGLSHGFTSIEACRFACAAASCTVESYGATEGLRSLSQVMKRV